jgi:CRISPR/Cas system-associated endonuclease Cas1
MDRQWPRRAITPAHALLNYTYAILETEAVIAAHTIGLDPSLGLMHADVRYRSSLASDLMEPVRPLADQFVLELLHSTELERGDVVENRAGVCRLGPPMARALAKRAPELAAAVLPHAHKLAQTLLHQRKRAMLTA